MKQSSSGPTNGSNDGIAFCSKGLVWDRDPTRGNRTLLRRVLSRP